MEVTHPRRILAVSLETSTKDLSQVIKDLTGAHPEPASSSLAGITHNLPLKTAYYTAQVPIWLDLVSSPSEWSASFLAPEAKEVLEVLGGVVVIFSVQNGASAASVSEAKELIAHVGRVVKEGLGGWDWDGVSLGIGVGDADFDALDEWDEACAEWGLEFVHAKGQAADAKNEFGERVGIARALEALESNDWAQATGLGDDEDLDGSDFGEFATAASKSKAAVDNEGGDDIDFDPENLDFGFDREDFAGLRQAIWSASREREESSKGENGGPADPGPGEEDIGEEDVQKLERMMRKLQAVRDMNEGLPEEQRRRRAKQAVEEVMKEL